MFKDKILEDKKRKIKEFVLTDRFTYRITFEDGLWSFTVSRKDGAVEFGKFSYIAPDRIDRFEILSKNGKFELCLHFNNDFGPHINYIGETTNLAIFKSAEAWVTQVNKLYENRPRRQVKTEAAD
jgi:hypothetical protein